MKILLVTPPMTQLNTPYPATAYLTGFLRSQGHDCAQADPAIDLVLRLFSRSGLERVLAEIDANLERALPAKGARLKAREALPPSVNHLLFHRDQYLSTVEAAVRFLQGKDPSLAIRIAGRRFLPEGPRFRALSEFSNGVPGGDAEQLAWAFGALGVQDQAKYLASLYVDDLADVIREGIDPRFELSRYGEKLAASEPTFQKLAHALASAPTLVDRMLDEITGELLEKHRPDVFGFTAPFPGNVYGAFRMAKVVRERAPDVKTVLGGGYPNTELRDLAEPRVFDYFDAVTLDDGEKPFLCLLEYFSGKRASANLLRTFVRENGEVRLKYDATLHDIPSQLTGCPTYDGLALDSYLSIFEMPNPMHRIWSDGRWNKLTLAHGCYWKKCNFCDVTLDYIGRYDANPADLIVDRMETLVRETGQSGFHFVDEAAPPAVLKQMASRLLDRGLVTTWWGNVRFEKAFTPEVAMLLARSGCVAVSGGLEVASDRLLKLMNKGVTVEQVARVTKALTDAGIMVHAYLMYGFPTETVQETVDSLERVRQLFEEGCIQSAYWHRFSATIHSPIGRDPARFGIELIPQETNEAPRFARNDLPFHDPSGVDHDALGRGLKRALYNYMHGLGLDLDVREWFDIKVPKAKVEKGLVRNALREKGTRASGDVGKFSTFASPVGES